MGGQRPWQVVFSTAIRTTTRTAPGRSSPGSLPSYFRDSRVSSCRPTSGVIDTRPRSSTLRRGATAAAGALSDALDVVATVSSWRELPRVTRWLVAASAGGAALAGAAGSLVAGGAKPDRDR